MEPRAAIAGGGGGRVVLRVPSLIHLLQLFTRKEWQDVSHHKTLIQCLYGTQGQGGDFHFNGFTELTLRDDLRAAGFEIVRLKLVDEWMFEAVARKVAHVAPEPMLRLETDAAFLDAAYRALLGRELTGCLLSGEGLVGVYSQNMLPGHSFAGCF